MRAILTYHSVDDSGSSISIGPDVFRRHQAWLTSGAVRVLSLDDLVATGPGAGDAVAVTFDDGFMNTRGPIERLLGEGVPVTLFTVTGHVGGTNAWGGREAPGIPTMPLLGWDDLEELVARGAGVGTHTRTHTPLTTVPSKALEEELIGPVRDLAARLGVQARHLAYPYGDVDARVVAAAAAHYECACTTEFRAVSPAADSLRLPRLDMYYFRARGALEAWGTSRFTLRLAWCRARRTLRAALAGRSSTLRLSTSR